MNRHRNSRPASKFQPILVVWEDFAVHGGWHHHDAALTIKDSPYIVYSVGFLLAFDKKRLTLSVGYDEEGTSFQEVMIIPVGMIQKINFLGVMKHAPKRLGTITK